MNNKYIAIGVVILVVAVGVYAFSKKGAYQAPAQTQNQNQMPMNNGTAMPPSQMPQGNTTPSTGAAPTGSVAPKSFSVNGNDMSADLTSITVAKGTPVTITFGADAQGTYHGGLDFRSSVVSTGPIAPGTTKTVSFTANQSFSFQPYWPTTNIAKPYMINIVVQ